MKLVILIMLGSVNSLALTQSVNKFSGYKCIDNKDGTLSCVKVKDTQIVKCIELSNGTLSCFENNKK